MGEPRLEELLTVENLYMLYEKYGTITTLEDGHITGFFEESKEKDAQSA